MALGKSARPDGMLPRLFPGSSVLCGQIRGRTSQAKLWLRRSRIELQEGNLYINMNKVLSVCSVCVTVHPHRSVKSGFFPKLTLR